MKPFPLPLHTTGSNHTKVVLDAAQEGWFCEYYPVTETWRVADAMGVCREVVRRLAKELGIGKSEKGLAQIRKRSGRRAAKTNEKNGCFERKRKNGISEATKRGLQKRWEKIQEGILDNPLMAFKKKNPRKFKKLMEKKSANRRELIRKEKMRMLYGLERKTNIKVVVLQPYTQSQTHRRCSALKRGYLLDYDCSEGSVGRYTIYYDDDTQRSEKFEDNCRKDGFTFKRDE